MMIELHGSFTALGLLTEVRNCQVHINCIRSYIFRA